MESAWSQTVFVLNFLLRDFQRNDLSSICQLLRKTFDGQSRHPPPPPYCSFCLKNLPSKTSNLDNDSKNFIQMI